LTADNVSIDEELKNASKNVYGSVQLKREGELTSRTFGSGLPAESCHELRQLVWFVFLFFRLFLLALGFFEGQLTKK
jgi:hypothetical protein